jgi:hypothetical protein
VKILGSCGSKSKRNRTHSDSFFPAFRAAFATFSLSCFDSLIVMTDPLPCPLGSFGLPILGFFFMLQL